MGHVFGALDEYAPPAAWLPEHGRPHARGTSGCATATRRPGRRRRRCSRASCAGPTRRWTRSAAGDVCRWTAGQTGPAGRRRRHAAGRGRHPAGVLHATRVHGRGRRRDAARHGDGTAPSPGPHRRRRLLPQGPEHRGAARGAVPGGRRRLAAAHRHRRRLRRAVGGMDADDGATRAGSPRPRVGGDDRRDGRPAQGPVGRSHAGHTRSGDERGVHPDRRDRRGREQRRASTCAP